MTLTYENPVIGIDWPDPGVFYDPKTKHYYAYATNGAGKNIQVAESPDFMSWHVQPDDALPGPPWPYWTGKPGFFWAPDVIAAPGGRPGYLMYVACHDNSTDKMAIGVAYSKDSPKGPFYFVSNGPIVSRGETGGCIDPCCFEDPQSGKRFLVYKNDYSHMRGPGPQVWIQELSEDGLTFAADRYGLLEAEHAWTTGLVEAPHLIYHEPTQTYVCFFSSGTFTENDYKIGYATSKNVYGPYKQSPHPFLETDFGRGIVGPGGQCVIKANDGNYFLVFHSHKTLDCQGGRCMSVARLEFDHEGRPVFPTRPVYHRRLRLGAEAEDGMPDHEADQRAAASGHGKPKHPHVSGFLKKAFNALS